MSGFLLDTCAISEFAKPRPNAGLVRWLGSTDPLNVFLSTITLGELYYGIALVADRTKRTGLERWLRDDVLADFAGRILDVDTNVADRWGKLRAASRRAAKALSPIDGLIAATGIQHGLAVVTRNEDDFRATGAALVNPWAES
ncbi:MAG: type II toxin-antitoxin system VapC family toxin [Vulcanimicrobiaceae bacterium]